MEIQFISVKLKSPPAFTRGQWHDLIISGITSPSFFWLGKPLNPSGFEIKSLFAGLTHGKTLSWQGAATTDGGKEAILGHWRQQD